MKMNKCNSAINEYFSWLGKQWNVYENGDGTCTIITPYTLSDGTNIEISFLPRNNRLILTDEGETINNLWLRGVDFDSAPSRRNIINTLIDDYGAIIEKGEIIIESSLDEIPVAIHNIIQVINAVDFLIYTKTSRMPRTFKEEVVTFFHEKQLSFNQDFDVFGKTAKHQFDIYVPRKEVALRTMSTGSPNYAKIMAEKLAYTYTDIKKINEKILVCPFIDDRSEEVIWSSEPLRILEEYSDKVYYWSNKEKAVKEIA